MQGEGRGLDDHTVFLCRQLGTGPGDIRAREVRYTFSTVPERTSGAEPVRLPADVLGRRPKVERSRRPAVRFSCSWWRWRSGSQALTSACRDSASTRRHIRASAELRLGSFQTGGSTHGLRIAFDIPAAVPTAWTVAPQRAPVLPCTPRQVRTIGSSACIAGTLGWTLWRLPARGQSRSRGPCSQESWPSSGRRWRRHGF